MALDIARANKESQQTQTQALIDGQLNAAALNESSDVGYYIPDAGDVQYEGNTSSFESEADNLGL